MSIRSIGAAAFILIPLLLAAEKGKITGTVRDASTGEPLWAANVVICEPEGNPVTGIATDSCGEYVIYSILEGTYSIEFSYLGYETLLKDSIQIKPGKITKVNASLIQSSIPMREIEVEADRKFPILIGGPPPPPLPGPIPVSSRPIDNIYDLIEDVVPAAHITP